MRANPYLTSIPVILLSLVSCSTISRGGFDPRAGSAGEAHRADTAFEVGAIASELAERAESRTSLGTARIQIGTLDAIEPRHSPYRQVTLLERDLRATQATLRHELEMALGNRMNVVGEGAELATHSIEGEFLRTADSLDLSLRLVELKSDWIVATARRRIDDFVPEYYDRRLQAPPEVLPETVRPNEASSPRAGELEAGHSRSRALRPAYPDPDSKGDDYPGLGPNVAVTPRPSDVLAVGGSLDEPSSRAASETLKNF